MVPVGREKSIKRRQSGPLAAQLLPPAVCQAAVMCQLSPLPLCVRVTTSLLGRGPRLLSKHV